MPQHTIKYVKCNHNGMVRANNGLVLDFKSLIKCNINFTTFKGHFNEAIFIAHKI